MIVSRLKLSTGGGVQQQHFQGYSTRKVPRKMKKAHNFRFSDTFPVCTPPSLERFWRRETIILKTAVVILGIIFTSSCLGFGFWVLGASSVCRESGHGPPSGIPRSGRLNRYGVAVKSNAIAIAIPLSHLAYLTSDELSWTEPPRQLSISQQISTF